MKKIVFILAVFMGVSTNILNAQVISGGVKAEANMSNFLLSDIDGKSTMKVGATVGGFAKIEFHENFALQPELLFHYKSSELKSGNFKTDYEYWGMEIPIYAVGQMNLGYGKGYLGLGPYVGFGFDAKYKSGDVKLYKDIKPGNKSYMNRFDFGMGVMAGYEFSNRVSINASYKMGFIDMLDLNKKDATMRNQSVSLGLAYRF